MEKSFTFEISRFTGLKVPGGSELWLKNTDSPHMVNFKITEGGLLKKREGYRTLLRSRDYGTGAVRGIWHGTLGGEELFCAVVGDVFLSSASGFEEMEEKGIGVLGEDEVFFFPFFGKLYLLTGVEIFEFDGEKLILPEPYVPLVMVATTPDGDGVLFEEKNILTNTVRQSFSPDGKSLHFNPVIRDVARVHWVKRNGKLVDPVDYYWDEVRRSVIFTMAPSAGVDNLEIKYDIKGESASERITRCRFAMGFGGSDTRAFLYGNPDDLTIRYHSGLTDGKPNFTYFPETAYTRIGSGEPITAILRHYDRQLIFTTCAAYYSFLEYRTGTDGLLLASFPVLPLSESYGSVSYGQALLMENTPVTPDGVGLCRWISTNIRDERNAQRFSESIAHALGKDALCQAKLFYRKATSELILCTSEHLFVYHEKQDLFYEYDVPLVRGFLEVGEDLYFFTSERICLVGGKSDDGEPIAAIWQSKLSDLSLAGAKKQIHHLHLEVTGDAGTAFAATLETERGQQKGLTEEILSEETKEISRRLDLRRAERVRLTLRAEGEGDLLISRVLLTGVAMNLK